MVVSEPNLSALFDQFYSELRDIARKYMFSERPNHTLQPTALVNEAYMRLATMSPLAVTDRAHFLRLAAKTMRRILVDHAREKLTAKRGGELTRVTLDDSDMGREDPAFDLIALDDAITKLARVSPRQASIVELRFFAGLSVEETAEQLELSARTIKGETRVARAWLRRETSD